jgi:hypothetical protein
MIQNEKVRVWVNRVLAFAVGGLAVLITMSLLVTAPVRAENADLTKEIDEIQNGAARLLNEANVFAEIGSYVKAKQSLDTLFEKHPASSEAADGADLYKVIDATIREKDQKWEAAVDSIRATWEQKNAEAMRAKIEQDRVLMETTMVETLAKEWARSEAAIRREWEKL